MASRDPQDSAAMPLPWWRQALGRLRAAVTGGVRTQVVATVGLAPLTLLFFQQVSLVGFAGNLVAIPLITLVITPLALLGCIVPILWSAAAATLTMLTAFLGWLAEGPGVLWSVGAAPWWAQAAGLFGAVLLVMPLPWRLRLLAVPLVWPMLLPPRDLPPVGQFDLVAVDVGQGTAVLVRTRHHLLVYDSGPQYAPEVDAGQRVLLPLLRARGEHRIDTLMLSHRDTDHVGGASTLLHNLPIAELTSSIEDAHPLRLQAQRLGIPARRCEAGQRWEWDGVNFEVLRPAAGDYALALRSNAISCVLRVQGASANDGSVLLTGDIEREQEIRLLRERPDALQSTVLIVPHHGSKTSSTAAFLDAVAPQVAVFQAGHLNRYGHPAQEVLARYRQRGIVRIDSPSCGAWTWRSGSGIGLPHSVCQRVEARRYWHWQPDPRS
jgi:competence protein ComEC